MFQIKNKKRSTKSTNKNWQHKKLLLTKPPVANLDPSTLKARQFCGPIPCRGADSLANSFAFDSCPNNSNNLHIKIIHLMIKEVLTH